MIIVWKWRHQENDHPIQGQGDNKDLYDIWTVEGNAENLLIRFDPDSSRLGQPTTTELLDSLRSLEQLITPYINQGYNIQLFLHESHGYRDTHVLTFNQKNWLNFKCVKFSGNDHLYITPRNPRGLLGRVGQMYAEMTDRPKIDAIVDREKRIINKVHFNNVWYYYQYLFNSATFELKEKFVRYYTPFLLLKEKNKSKKFPENKLLIDLLAYKSINVDYYAKKNCDENKCDKKNCAENKCAEKKEILNFYHVLCNHISNFESTKSVTPEHIKILRNAFQNLLNALPENTYA